MLKNANYRDSKLLVISILMVTCLTTSLALAEDVGWQRKEVDWRVSASSQIKAVHYPPGGQPAILSEYKRQPPQLESRMDLPSAIAPAGAQASSSVLVNVIDSPPLDGFIPWMVAAVTNENAGWDFNAYPEGSVVGPYLTGTPESDYAIGIYDTGASANLISVGDSIKTGMVDQGLVTTLTIELLGATGSAFAFTSDPVGLFVGGLDQLDENGLLSDDSALLGESNVSLIVGDPIQSPNVPTAIGAPMAAYVSSAFCNNNELSVRLDGTDYNCPYTTFFELGDPYVPSYSNSIDMELRPSDGSAVQYLPCELLGLCGTEPDGTPYTPSTIWGALTPQSLYFVPLVNLADGNDSLDNRTKFMFDTGAQITVISRTMVAGLHLSTDPCAPNGPEFYVEIQDVTGQVTMEPGYYLDSLSIPADGQWLEFTNVPVVAINVASPEGGNLEGIIGMNLFVDLNFVFTGGGMYGQPHAAVLEFEPACHIAGDIAGYCDECTVDYQDLDLIAEHWLETTASPDWNPQCDIAPEGAPDGKIDALDFALMAGNWMQTGPQP